MTKIYTASKLDHAHKWIGLSERWTKHEFVARWPRQHHVEAEDPYKAEAVFADTELMRKCWVEDIEDVQKSDVVLVYGEPGENLRGALVEAGAGIALHKIVLCVGDNENFGTWHNHPRCVRLDNLEQAKVFIDAYQRGLDEVRF